MMENVEVQSYFCNCGFASFAQTGDVTVPSFSSNTNEDLSGLFAIGKLNVTWLKRSIYSSRCKNKEILLEFFLLKKDILTGIPSIHSHVPNNPQGSFNTLEGATFVTLKRKIEKIFWEQDTCASVYIVHWNAMHWTEERT